MGKNIKDVLEKVFKKGTFVIRINLTQVLPFYELSFPKTCHQFPKTEIQKQKGGINHRVD